FRSGSDLVLRLHSHRSAKCCAEDQIATARCTASHSFYKTMKLRMPEMPSATLLAALESYNLLPVIVFMPTRRRCDQAASEAAYTRRDRSEPRVELRREFMRSFVEIHPEVRNHRH